MKTFGLALLVFAVSNCERVDLARNNPQIEKFISLAENEKISIENRFAYCNLAKSKISTNFKDSVLNRFNFRVAAVYLDLNKWTELKSIIEDTKINSNNMNDHLSVAKCNKYLGLYYEHASRNDSAYYFFSKAQKTFAKMREYKQLCESYQDLAVIEYYINNFANSEKSLVAALRVANKYGLNSEKYFIYIYFGLNAREQKDFEGALTYFNKALNLVNDGEVKVHRFHTEYCLNNIGYIYLLKGNLRKAQDLFQQAMSNPNIQEDPVIYARLRENLAKINLERKRLANVSHTLKDIHASRTKLGILEGQNFNRLYLSEYYAATKDTVKAIQYGQEAYNLSREFNAPNDMLLCLKHLSKINPGKSLAYASRYIKIADSMHQLERETRDKFAKIAYETEEITQEKELVEKEKSIWLGATVMMGGFGMLLIVIARQRIRQKELLLAQSQQDAKEEIYQLMHNQQSKIDAGRQSEKERIARELHDGVMNRLASTRYNLHILNNSTDPQTIRKCIGYIDGIHDIEKEIRNISHDLNNEVFNDNDSFKRILMTFFSDQKNILKAELFTDIDRTIKWELLKSTQKINLYRILQEGLQNANKYAQADHIFVNISNYEEYILLEIHDDGIGFKVYENRKGIGLKNLKARAKDCEGMLHISSASGSGTTIVVSIPIDRTLLT